MASASGFMSGFGLIRIGAWWIDAVMYCWIQRFAPDLRRRDRVPTCVRSTAGLDTRGGEAVKRGEASRARESRRCAYFSLCINEPADRSDITGNRHIDARVMPTKSLRPTSSSQCSKSISVKITQGADWPLKR